MKISVITVTLNALPALRETVRSVAAQDYPDMEYIVVDGGSTDGTVEFLETQGKTITRYISEPDKGLYDAMNKGILLATGDLLNFLNSGDMYYDGGVLTRVAHEFGKSGADILCCDFVKDLNGHRYYTKTMNRLDKAYQKMPTIHQAMFYKRIAFNEKRYDISYRICADYDHILYLIKQTNTVISFASFPSVIFKLGGLSDMNGILTQWEGVFISIKYYGWFKGCMRRGPKLLKVWLKEMLITALFLHKKRDNIRIFLYDRKYQRVNDDHQKKR